MAKIETKVDAQRGDTLIELLVALGIIAVTLTVFVTSLSTGAFGVAAARDVTRANNLALSQLESIKAQLYTVPAHCGDADAYATITVPTSYAVAAAACELEPGLEIITVTIMHQGETVVTLSNYKMNR